MRAFVFLIFLFAFIGVSVSAQLDSPMQKHAQIDNVAISPDRHTAVLTLIETRPWTQNGDNVLDLQEKLKTYLTYVEEGQLIASYPQLQGKPIVFRLVTQHPLNDQAKDFIAKVKEHWLSPAHISWEETSFTVPP